MGALSSLFQRGRPPGMEADPNRKPIKEPDVGTLLKVYVGGLPLLTGPISAISEKALVIGRQPGQRDLETCRVGESAYARVLDDLMCYLIRGEVTSSTGRQFQMEHLSISFFEERRESFRLDVDAPVEIYRELDYEQESVIERCRLVNLSADGLCFTASTRFDVGKILLFSLMIPERKPILIPGRIVRVHKMPRGGYQYGVCFHQAGRRDSEAVARTLFDIQRARRKAQLLAEEEKE